MTKKLLPSQNKSWERSALQLNKVNNNTEILEPVNYLPPATERAEELEPTEEILQAVLLGEDPTANKKGRVLAPLSSIGILLFLGANILVAVNIFGKLPPQQIINSQPQEETKIPNVPNLAATELVKLDRNTIITIKPSVAATTTEQPPLTDNIVEIPGAYRDLAASLLPPALRPLTKSYTVEAIAVEESQKDNNN